MKQYIPHLTASLITLLLVPFSKFIVRKIVTKYGQLTLKTENRIQHVLRVIYMLINFTCIISLAVIWGVNPQNMILALSSIFAVIGVAMFAQWSILSNVTAGIIIFFTTPFRVGDEIQIIDKDTPIEATIESILTFHTYLRMKNGEQIIIPNTLFMQKVVAIGKEKDKK